MRHWLPIVANMLAFHTLWTLTVVGIGREWWWVGPAFIAVSAVLQAWVLGIARREVWVIVAGAAIGMTLDAAARACGVLRVSGDSPVQFAVTFFALWVHFGTTLPVSLRWMWDRPLLASAIGAIGGPLSYWGASRLGGVEWIQPMWRGVAWAGVQYAIAVPVWMLALRRISAARDETDHRANGPSPRPQGGR